MSKLSITAQLLAGVALIAAGEARAQAPSGDPQTHAPSDDAGSAVAAASDQRGIADIIVTAQKRSESINKVGLAITALSGDSMKALNIKDVKDLAQVVPGLTFAASLLDTPVYSLRGVGFYETSLAAYPDVSVYVDQVPLPFPVLTQGIGLDLERVEVLKGPQGILFGQNATGGAINYIAAKPTDDFHAGLSLGYGRFNDLTANGYISGPLTDTLKSRLSFQSEHASPWQRSYYQPDHGENGAVSRYAVRLLTDWTPSDRLKVELNLNAGLDQSEPQAPQYIGLQLQQTLPGNVPSPNGLKLLAYPFAPDKARAADFSARNHPRSNNRQFQASLRADYSLSEDITLTSISSYIHYKRNENVEFGGVALEDEELTKDFGSVNSFFEEVRVANNPADHIRVVIGANYGHDKVGEYNQYSYPGSSADVTGLSSTPFFSNQTMNNYAVFGNVDWDVTHNLTLKGGLRYTEADRHQNTCTLGSDGGGIDALFDFLVPNAFHAGDGTFTPEHPYVPLGVNDCITLNPVTLLSERQGYIANLNEHNLSWRGGFDYKPTSNLLFYVNIAKGYKAGSFPMLSASTTIQFLPVKQESVLDYEGGFKLSLFNHTVQLNGSGFHYDYTNKQIRTQTVQPIFGILNNLQNVPKSTVDGGELELTWQPLRGLQLSAAGTYLSSRIVRFSGTNGAGESRDFAGDPVPYSPKFAGNALGDYRWRLSDTLDASIGATLTYRSKSYATVGPTPIDVINPYTLLDLRAGISTHDNRYQFQIYGKNVTNKFYWNNVSHPYDTIVRYTGMPVTYGVTFGMRL
jgi:outer membrane receptor protein involved in Fe transport